MNLQISFWNSNFYGERKQVRMPDGTLLTLNSFALASVILIVLKGNERKVELEGEG